jgi:hypothetical protein
MEGRKRNEKFVPFLPAPSSKLQLTRSEVPVQKLQRPKKMALAIASNGRAIRENDEFERM